MSDIFLSYAKEDRERARKLGEALAATGWTVFWDRDIPVGSTWESVVERQLERVKALVVLWSRASVESEWVQIEANEAADRRMLVPVFIEEVRPPLRFRRLHGADLTEWAPPYEESPQVTAMVSAVRERVNQS